MEFSQVKIEIFIPEEFMPALLEAVGSAGAGKIGKISEGHECKVEVNCPAKAVHEVVRAIRKVHPYEEPLINIVPLLNDLY